MRQRSRAARHMKRALVASCALVVAAASFGFLAQRRMDARALAEHPAPGMFVQVGDHRLHYRTAGAGDVTFVLEAGLGDYSGSWDGLDSVLAQMGRVIVYDRAGYGWSEPGPAPRTIQQITAELHELLRGAGVPGPYVLVGHSLGGAVMTRYALDHAASVAGLLLLDPSHPEQVARLPPPPFVEELVGRQVPRTASIGLASLLFGSSDPMRNRATHIATFGAELRAVERSIEQWGEEPIDLGRLPVYVLTAGKYEDWPGGNEAERRAAWEIWRTLHAELVASSSSGIRRHIIVPGAGHYVHHDDPAAVANAARDLMGRITDSGGS